jgi:hypothetical protein
LYYTYLHYGADNKPIYVGKGSNDRAYKKRDYEEPYTVKIVHDNISEAQALEFEEFLIQEIGIDNLYNKYKKGVISGKGSRQLIVNYYNLPRQIKIMSKRSPKDIRKFLEIVIDDACKGNDIAMSYIIKKLPKHTLNKIKELLETNSVKKYAI